VALVLDASEPLSNQDARIAGMITEAGKSLLFLFNKWDLVEKETGTAEAFTRKLKYTFPLLATSPVLYVSAMSGLRVSRIPPLVRDLAQERLRQIPTSALNETLQEATRAVHPPVRRDGKALKLFYGTQVAVSPPTFAIFTNDPNGVPSAYQSYIKNFFREHLGFPTAPLRIIFRARQH
jgi:GTP-binding protein